MENKKQIVRLDENAIQKIVEASLKDFFRTKSNVNEQHQQKKTIKLNESQIEQMVENSVRRILSEEMSEEDLNEWVGQGAVDRVGAAFDAIRNGGGYKFNLNQRQLDRAKKDTENLMNKYGVQAAQNGNTYVKQNSQDAIAQINTKYDKKIEDLEAKTQQQKQSLEAQRQQEISKATGKVQGQWNKYQKKKGNLDQRRKTAYRGREKAFNNNPIVKYAQTKQQNQAAE